MKNNIIVVFSSHLSDEENKLFIKHIDNTIGKIQHKVICYPNFNEYSLTEIYNRSIRDHNNDSAIMVFLHNDIQFFTKNWGRLLLTKFNYSDYQIIGVAGTTTLSESGCWWSERNNMVGVVSHTDGIKVWTNEYNKPIAGKITPVVLIDGLFMAVDCNDIEYQFDEEFKGFHFYDISFCFKNFIEGINIGVTTDIRILHKSVGQTNDQWERSRLQFVEKYKDDLPLDVFNK